MLGETISGRALGDAGRRELPTEQIGPRPGAVRDDATAGERADERTAAARKP